MGNAGLLLVGVVLLVNGLVILSVVPPRSAALLNVFVGGAQVVLPTIILIQHSGDAAVVNATWPTYLFGITYLYYGLGIYLNLEPQGLGWFSAFVAVIVAYLAIDSIATDPVFAVMAATWATMWSLFFALMALGRERLNRFTAWFLITLGVPSCTLTGILQLDGHWSTTAGAGWAALAVLAAGALASVSLARSSIARGGAQAVGADPAGADVPAQPAADDPTATASPRLAAPVGA